MTTNTAASPNTALTFRLRDGRAFGYAEYGDPAGRPVFFFHGFPGSRLSGAIGHAAAAKHGARVISIDRPGYGLSDFKPGRTFLDWPEDVTELAATLGIDRFGVAGISGGGPYAAACASAISQRLTGTYIISGVGPFETPGATNGMSRQNKILFWLGRRAPSLGGVLIRVMARAARNPSDKTMDRMARSMPEPDRVVLQQADIRAAFIAQITRGILGGLFGGRK